MTELVLREEVYEIIGAAMEVYYQLGRGFAEPIYQEALAVELAHRRIPFEAQQALTVYYKGRPLLSTYKPDFICYGKVVVELKALDRLSRNEVAQLLNYLKVTRHPVGLLITLAVRSSLNGSVMSLANSSPMNLRRLVLFREISWIALPSAIHEIHEITRTNAKRKLL